MSITVDPSALSDLAVSAKRISSDVGNIASSIRNIKNSISADVMQKGNLYGTFDSLCTKIDSTQTRITNIGNFLDYAASTYSNTDQGLKNNSVDSQLENKAAFANGKLDDANRLRNQSIPLGGVAGMDAAALYSSDPVNLSNGNYVYEKTFFNFDTPISINLRVFYNVCNTLCGSLGIGWDHNFEKHIHVDNDITEVVLEDGTRQLFRRSKSALYSNLPGSVGALSEDQHGYVYIDEEKDIYHFDRSGRLLYAETIDGWKLSLSYHGNRLSSVSCTDGISLCFSYADSKLLKVEDHTGRTVSFEYERDLLTAVTDPMGGRTKFAYDEKNRLYKVLSPSGDLSVHNEYDPLGRTVQQTFADGGILRYSYNVGEKNVVLQRQNGSKVTYYHDDLFRNVRTVFSDGEERIQYNDNNQRTAFIDKLGRTTRFSYNSKGDLTGVTNAEGTKFELAYNDNGQLTEISVDGKRMGTATYDEKRHQRRFVNANGGSSEFEYDSYGRLTEVIHEDGSKTSLTYDEKGNIISAIEPIKGRTEYAYDDCHRVVSTIDACGNKTEFRYDALDQIIQVINAEGNARSYAYDSRGNLVRITDFNGGLTSIEYNAMNRPVKITDPEGHTVQYEYDLMSNLIKKTAADGGVTEYGYDGESRLVSIRYPNGETERAEYDPVGNIIRRQAQDGAVFCLTYDALDRPLTVTDPDNGVRKAIYDELGNVTAILYEDGTREEFTFDLLGNRTSYTDQNGYTRYYRYNEVNELVEIKDEDGVIATFTYGPGGQLLSERGSAGEELNYFYDQAGNITAIKDSVTGSWKFAYNSLLQLVSVEHVGEGIEHYEYDLLGNISAVIDGSGNKTQYQYSKTGTLQSVIDSRGNETRYLYDPCDRLTQILQTSDGHFAADKISELNNKQRIIYSTTYTRDLEGNVIKVQESDGGVIQFTYDACGRIISRRDQEGYVTKCTYGLAGTIDKLTFDDGRTITCQYDALKRLTQLEDWLGITRVDRDAAGNVVSVTDHEGNKTCYTWNGFGKCTSLKYPNGDNVSYEYDEKRRLSRCVSKDAEVAMSYLPNGLLQERRYSNNVRVAYRYDPLGRISQLTSSSAEGTIESISYEYDSCARKKSICYEQRNASRTEYRYFYDPLGFMTKVLKDGTVDQLYEYDHFGNRTKKVCGDITETYGYDGLDRLAWKKTGTDECRYAYDKRGNLISETLNGQDRLRLRFDALDRLASAESEYGQAEYFYNGFAACDHVVRRYQGNSQRVKYLFDIQKENHLLGVCQNDQWENIAWDGIPVMSWSQGGSSCLLHDERMSGLAIARKQAVDCYSYDAFGKAEGEKPELFAFAGFRSDSVTGYYDAGWRQYDASTGRFISKDPVAGSLAIPASMNPFIYCLADPINHIDPTGMILAWLAGGIVGSVINVGTKFAGDVVKSISTGKAQFSSWQSYTGAAVGGFVQGSVMVASGGNAAIAGAAGSATETLVTNGLNMATGVEGYRKEDGYNIGSLVKDTAVSGLKGAAAGSIFNWSAKYLKLPGITAGKGSYVSVFKQVMTKAERGIIAHVTGSTLVKGLVSFGLVKTCDTIVKKGIDTAKEMAKNGVMNTIESVLDKIRNGKNSNQDASAIKNLSCTRNATCSTT